MRLKRISNIVKYGIGPEARRRKHAAKRERREEVFQDETRWTQGDGLARRNYDSYEDYLRHQSAKLDEIGDRLRRREDQDLAAFRDRFAQCAELKEARSVLCLGARLGTEVRALHDLGHFAVGIDLNPGQGNAYVLPGDFHAIVFPDGSIDAVYTNALDHVFDLEKVIAEVRRLLRPNGLFLVEVEIGFEEGFVPGDYEAIHWRDSQALLERVRDIGGFGLDYVRDLEEVRNIPRKQALFRKPA